MVDFIEKPRYDFGDLRALVAFLRSENGCPWDSVQTHASIRRNLLEEAYEACEGIDLDDADLMKEEFGDVLLQAVFHVSIEEDAGRFSMEDVIDGVCKKLIFRHPHLFAGVKTEDWDWEEMKKQEKGVETQTQVLQSVARSLPALIRAEKLNSKLMKMGFAWDDPAAAVDYARTALDGLTAAKDPAADLGNALLALTGACKAMGLEAEEALHAACEGAIARFAAQEEAGGAKTNAICQFLPQQEN